MKILLCSHVFSPTIGGMQTVAEVLSAEFVAAGHEVTVVTQTPGPEDGFPFRVVRRPGPLGVLGWVRWCDVVLANGPSLRCLLPAWVAARPLVVGHHIWMAPPTWQMWAPDAVRAAILRRAVNIANSGALAASLGVPAKVIPNPYDEEIFSEDPTATRDRDLVFLGRLIPEKGADVLLDAVARLGAKGLRPSVTVIGGGPEGPQLRARAGCADLAGQVRFTGALRGAALAAELNRHRLVVVPSRCEETFGIVALEGMACGCVVVASSGGGLPEAVGSAGVTFPSGDAGALAEVLRDLLRSPERMDAYRRRAVEHLAAHRRASIAAAYLDVLYSVAHSSHQPRV